VALVEVALRFQVLSANEPHCFLLEEFNFDVSPTSIDFPKINVPSNDDDYHYIMVQHEFILDDQNGHSLNDYVKLIVLI
jgi:hypothetical protein